MHPHKLIGVKSEDFALEYLINQGLIPLNRNFSSRYGEIDLIMQDGEVTVFIEVKKRHSGHNDALESITLTKQRKLKETAKHYIFKTGKDTDYRFDVVAFDGLNTPIWLKNVII